MEQRISMIGLGVKDLARAKNFYQAMGWEPAPDESPHIVCFNLLGAALMLYPWERLAEDAQVAAAGSGFRGVTMAHNVPRKEDVSPVLQAAAEAGGRIVKPAQDVFWGGYSGYFADPDEHLWEVAWNPMVPLGEHGEFQWPKS